MSQNRIFNISARAAAFLARIFFKVSRLLCEHRKCKTRARNITTTTAGVFSLSCFRQSCTLQKSARELNVHATRARGCGLACGGERVLN